ncbi:MAG: FIG01121307: hypothetical protein, partial [uncultured Corynebacteriales bacterium]
GRPVHPVDRHRRAAGRDHGGDLGLRRLPRVGRVGEVRRGAVHRRGRPPGAGPVHPGRRPGQGRVRAVLRLARRRAGRLGAGPGPGAEVPARVVRAGPPGGVDRGDLPPRRRPDDPDARHAQAQGRTGDHGHRAQGAQEARRGL